MTHRPIAPVDVVRAYRNAGWDLPFPLPAGKKFPPPEGFTGAGGRYPTNDDAARWMVEDRYGNYGIRAPHGVVGIDWDAYKGGALYSWIVPFVDTAPRSTSKGGDQNAAIYWVRVDADLVEQLRDRHFAETGTEVIRAQHRYGVVWPSIHPDTGDRYEWYGPLAGTEPNEAYAEPLDYPPSIDDLPVVPRATVEAAIAQYGGGKRTSSGVSGRRVATGLERDVELSELGGLRALLKGYQAYEPNPDRETNAARVVWESERIRAICDELDELVASADAWESAVGTLTFKLVSLALAPWSELELDEIIYYVEQYGPTCAKAEQRGVHGHGKGRCWTAADNRARAERSMDQHDGGWTQLPPPLRGSVPPKLRGPHVSEVADDSNAGSANVREVTSDDDDDDFFDDEVVPVRRDAASLFLRLDRSLARQTRPKPIAGGMLYAGVFNIVSGRGGLGKSTAVQAICAQHSLPHLWLSTEESWGAVHDRALVLGYEDCYAPSEPLTVLDCDVIFDWLTENEQVRTCVIDNLQAFFKLGNESNINTVVRDAFLEFWTRAEALGMTLIGVSHPPKSGATTVQGSAAWEEVSRHVLKMHEMDEDGYSGLALTVAKTNYHTRAYDTWPVEIQTVEIPIPAADGSIETTSMAVFPENDTLRELLRGAMGGYVADHKAKAEKRANSRHRDDLPEVGEIDTLLTGGWVEPGSVAAQFEILPTRVRALAEKHDLEIATAADGRLVWIHELGDAPPNPAVIELGTHAVEGLVRELGVGQVTHLTWLISAAGLTADYQDDRVTITNPERDEAADALRDAGLEDI